MVIISSARPLYSVRLRTAHSPIFSKGLLLVCLITLSAASDSMLLLFLFSSRIALFPLGIHALQVRGKHSPPSYGHTPLPLLQALPIAAIVILRIA